jgi:hypothetical protein
MYRRKNRQNEIEIQLEDVELILSENYPSLDFFLSSVYCAQCQNSTEVKDLRIYLDDSNDIILDGSCINCKQPVSRYIETGESVSSAEAAKHIRAVKHINK